MMHAFNLNYKSKLKHCLPGIWTECSSLILLREKLLVGVGFKDVIQIHSLARASIQGVM